MAGQSQAGVYVKDDNHGWLPSKVLSLDSESKSNTVHVEVTVPILVHGDGVADTDTNEYEYEKQERKVNLKDYENETLPLQNMDEGGNSIVVPDMCDLPSLHEAAILYNLKARHEDLKPYTRVGDIVIAMNPFQVSYITL